MSPTEKNLLSTFGGMNFVLPRRYSVGIVTSSKGTGYRGAGGSYRLWGSIHSVIADCAIGFGTRAGCHCCGALDPSLDSRTATHGAMVEAVLTRPFFPR